MSDMLATILFSVSKKKSRSFAKYAKKKSQEKGSVLEKTEIRSFAVQSPSQATIFKIIYNFPCSCSYVWPSLYRHWPSYSR